MLEGVRLHKDGNFRKDTSTYIYKEACIRCGESYLMESRRQTMFCGTSCANKGKKFSVEHKKNMSTVKVGKVPTIETRKKLCKSRANRVGVLSPCYKGGVTKTGSIAYDTGKKKLGLYEEVRKQKGTKILEVKCVYCGRWFAPKWYQVRNRLVAINNLNKGEQRLYCSENCKLACPTYGKVKYPRGFKHTTSREVNPYLRQMVLKRDNWICQICGKTIKEAQLHVHHMDPAIQNPMFQNDMDSCITLCKSCHAMVHSRRGCRYVDLQCKTETDYTKKIKKGEGLKSVGFQE
jgi:5-methylcytosine-specific restriction endonuclease McrA